jgi:hypothetical protein
VFDKIITHQFHYLVHYKHTSYISSFWLQSGILVSVSFFLHFLSTSTDGKGEKEPWWCCLNRMTQQLFSFTSSQFFFKNTIERCCSNIIIITYIIIFDACILLIIIWYVFKNYLKTSSQIHPLGSGNNFLAVFRHLKYLQFIFERTLYHYIYIRQ